jgi:hypothetical protein
MVVVNLILLIKKIHFVFVVEQSSKEGTWINKIKKGKTKNVFNFKERFRYKIKMYKINFEIKTKLVKTSKTRKNKYQPQGNKTKATRSLMLGILILRYNR